MVLAALVTRMSPRRTVSASRPTCGRTSDDPRPRCSVATSTRTASGHCSIRGSPQTAAAEVTANTGSSRSRHRPVAWTSAACSCSGVRPRHSCSLTHTPFRTWCQPPRVGSMPAARRSRPRRRMHASNGVGAGGPSIRSPCQKPRPPPAALSTGLAHRPPDRSLGGVRSTSPAQDVLAESGSYPALTRRSAPDFARERRARAPRCLGGWARRPRAAASGGPPWNSAVRERAMHAQPAPRGAAARRARVPGAGRRAALPARRRRDRRPPRRRPARGPGRRQRGAAHLGEHLRLPRLRHHGRRGPPARRRLARRRASPPASTAPGWRSASAPPRPRSSPSSPPRSPTSSAPPRRRSTRP